MNDKIWEQLNLKQMNELVEEMTNLTHYSFEDVARELAGGNMGEVLRMIGATVADVCLPGIRESKGLLTGILVLGLFSVLLHYTFGIVKSRQVADLASYFVYLILILLLLENFGYVMETGREVLDLCRQFIAALVPAYCLSVSLAAGAAGSAAYYEFVLLLLLGIDYILAGLLLPMTQSYIFLIVMDGLDEKHRMKEFVKLLGRMISWGLRICLTVTVVISGVQSTISVQMDGVQKTVFQKAVGAIPGIGDLSESVSQILLGSAGLIKNSIGSAAMVFLFLLILRPLWKVFCISFTMKLAGACVRLMGQKSLADTITGIGEGGILVLRVVVCAAIAICISIAMTMFVMKGGA
ncbi:MAG: stage III sporulation protein AE [Lachnospiraceae bacterium]|nr:stage III sporulation protein AE [Lachnospiraceae bacterium]